MPIVINGTTGVSGVDGSAGTPALQGGDTNTGIVFGTDTVGVSTGGVQRTTVDSSGRLLVGVGSANANGGILQLTSGITFPATAVAASDANTLDDYEEGTWTAAFATGGGSITIDPSFNTGGYTKVGRLVTVNIHARFSSVSSPTGYLSITGLPFTANSSNQCRNAGACAAIAITTLATPMTAYVSNNDADIYLTGFDAASGGYANAATYINASSELYITVTYYV
jgi:hypothetical protein